MALALGAALIPLGVDDRIDLTQWSATPVAYFSNLPAHGYRLIKTAILWALVGFLYTLAFEGRTIKTWAPLGILILLVVGWVVVPDPGFGTVLEVLYAVPGLALGLWLAGRSRAALSAFPSDRDAAAQETETPWQARPVAKQESAHVPAVRAAGATLFGRAAALLLASAAGYSLFQFPFMRPLLAVGLAAYAVALWRFPSLWLVFVPAAAALLDLAPWTGRFFWDEFDLLMLVTLAVALRQGRLSLSAWMVPKLGVLLGLFVMFWGVSLLVGLFPLQPLDANAFSVYWSHYNSLRLGKGLLWGLVVYALYRSQPDETRAFIRLSTGMALGVLGVSLWSLWEQALFAGAATTADYRVTAGFSSMHTGGGHIEAYLVIALPFVWGLFFLLRNPLYRALLGVDFLLGAYALFFTVSRGGAIALGVALVILLLGIWLARRKAPRHRIGLAAPIAMAVLTLVVMAAGLSSDFWKQRLEQTADDAGIRFRHWAEVLSMRDSGVMTALFGQGLGTLPAVNLASQLPDQAGTYRYVSEGGNTFLTLNSAGTLYMAQRVVPHPGENLRLEISVRAPSTQSGLEASLCEKILFNSRQCQWLKVDVKAGAQEWQHHTQTFNSGEVGAGNLITRRPVQFSLYNPVPGTLVEIDNVRLLDERGQDLLKNGDFSKGGDFWFFKSGDHLFWHIKNLWVHLLFEQGWLGVVLFSMIMMVALVRLLRAMGQGRVEATVMLAVLGAWSTVGIVDSLVDAPRLALLVYALLFISAAWGAAPRSSVKPGKRSRRHHRRHDSGGAPLPA